MSCDRFPPVEEDPEEPVEVVAAVVVPVAAEVVATEPVAPEVEAPAVEAADVEDADCAATAACVNAANKLEKRLDPEVVRPSDAVDSCAPPAPVAPGERWGGDCRGMRPLKPEMALVDIMLSVVANDI
jgi:hypothetical protein